MADLDIKIRHEGEAINAYFPTSTKPGEPPILIASMRTSMADMHPEIFDAFVAFVTLAARTMLEGIGVKVHSITEHRAPEHERSGHA